MEGPETYERQPHSEIVDLKNKRVSARGGMGRKATTLARSKLDRENPRTHMPINLVKVMPEMTLINGFSGLYRPTAEAYRWSNVNKGCEDSVISFLLPHQPIYYAAT